MKLWSSGHPPPEVVWLHDGQEVTESEDFHLLREDNSFTLLIQEVFPEDTGTYSCRAWNQYGKDQTQAKLTVQGNHRLSTLPRPLSVPRHLKLNSQSQSEKCISTDAHSNTQQ